jgi:hypothetical protein
MASRVRRKTPRNPAQSLKRKAQPAESIVSEAVTRYSGLSTGATTDFFDHKLWERANQNQLGVIGWDPLGHRIGWAYQDGSLKNYTPMSEYKQTLVGRLLDYEFYDEEYVTPDEADWCLLMDPDPPFAFLRDEVVKLIPSWQRFELRVAAGRIVVECEVTPDEKWYDNGYFGKTNHKSPNLFKTVGLYGPWVRDGGHGGRPEIHPCELIWWRDTGADGLKKWTFLVVQDDSNRFDRKTDYDGGTVYRAWSAPPRRAAFAVALELRLGFRSNFELSVRRHRNMAVLDPPTSTNDPSKYVLRATPSPSGPRRIPPGPPPIETVGVEVKKRITRERDIGPGDKRSEMKSSTLTIPRVPDTSSPGMLKASLSNVVKELTQTTVYRCFLNFEVQVGTTNDRGGEGYAEIVLQQRQSTQLGGQKV